MGTGRSRDDGLTQDADILVVPDYPQIIRTDVFTGRSQTENTEPACARIDDKQRMK